MKRVLLLLFLLTFSVCDIALMAQQSNTGCYSKLKREGQIAYDAGNYPKAIGLWESAKKCSDVPAENNLQALINQAKSRMTPPPPPPDRDNDGVPDSRDKCPSQAGPPSNGGCPPPPPDRDNDGIPDSRDKCPSEAGTPSNGGCPVPSPPPPDLDSDGIPDTKDKCPSEAGPLSNQGCPLPPILPSAISNENDNIYTEVEEMPIFPGCESEPDKVAQKKCSDRKVFEFIGKNLRYPVIAREKSVEGTVVVQFIVDRDGMVKDASVLIDIGAGCGEEALRVVRLMTQQGLKWTPGKQNNRIVKVRFRIPVRFNLN